MEPGRQASPAQGNGQKAGVAWSAGRCFLFSGNLLKTKQVDFVLIG